MARISLLVSIGTFFAIAFAAVGTFATRAAVALARFTEDIVAIAFPYTPREPQAWPSLARSESAAYGVGRARSSSFQERRAARLTSTRFGEPCLSVPVPS